jgi:hypothetical protein
MGNESKVKKKEMYLMELERLRLSKLFFPFSGGWGGQRKRDLKKEAPCWLSPLLFVYFSCIYAYSLDKEAKNPLSIETILLK